MGSWAVLGQNLLRARKAGSTSREAGNGCWNSLLREPFPSGLRIQARTPPRTSLICAPLDSRPAQTERPWALFLSVLVQSGSDVEKFPTRNGTYQPLNTTALASFRSERHQKESFSLNAIQLIKVRIVSHRPSKCPLSYRASRNDVSDRIPDFHKSVGTFIDTI